MATVLLLLNPFTAAVHLFVFEADHKSKGEKMRSVSVKAAHFRTYQS